MDKKKIPAEKPSLKSRGKRLNDGTAIGMPKDHPADEAKSIRDTFKGNDK